MNLIERTSLPNWLTGRSHNKRAGCQEVQSGFGASGMQSQQEKS